MHFSGSLLAPGRDGVASRRQEPAHLPEAEWRKSARAEREAPHLCGESKLYPLGVPDNGAESNSRRAGHWRGAGWARRGPAEQQQKRLLAGLLSRARSREMRGVSAYGDEAIRRRQCCGGGR